MHTRESLLAELRKLADVRGPDVTLFEFRVATGINPYHVYHHWGNWTRLRLAAGLPVRPCVGPVYSDEELLAELNRTACQLHDFPTSAEFNRLSDRSWQTLTQRFGDRDTVLNRYRDWTDGRTRSETPSFIANCPAGCVPSTVPGVYLVNSPLLNMLAWLLLALNVAPAFSALQSRAGPDLVWPAPSLTLARATFAGRQRQAALFAVHGLQDGLPTGAAVVAGPELFEAPGVEKDPAAAEFQALAESVMQRRQRGAGEPAVAGQLLHRPVPAASGNDADAARSGVKGDLQRPQHPLNPFGLTQPGKLLNHKSPHIAVVGAQIRAGPLIVGHGHLFVQPRQQFGMNGLQPHRHFQPPGEPLLKFPHARPTQPGVILDDHRGEVLDPFSNRGVIRGRDGEGIEEIAAVVELDVPGRGQLGQCPVDLSGDGSHGGGFIEGVLPEVTKDTPKRALPIGEKQRRHIFHMAVTGPLGFHQKSVRPVRINSRFRPPQREDFRCR